MFCNYGNDESNLFHSTSAPEQDLQAMVQIGVLCSIMYSNAEYIFLAENMPTMFTVFNLIAMAMILGQSYVWKNKVVEIMESVTGKGKSNPMALGGFILAAILSGVAISQLYIILEYLRTDC